MATVEVVTFEMNKECEESAFLDADRRAQGAWSSRASGLIRRTTARGTGRSVLVVSLWSAIGDAERWSLAASDEPEARELAGLIDAGTLERRLFETLD